MAANKFKKDAVGFYEDNKTYIFMAVALLIYWKLIRPLFNAGAGLSDSIADKVNKAVAENNARKTEAQVKANNPVLKDQTSLNISKYKEDARALAVAFKTHTDTEFFKLNEDEAAAAAILANYKLNNTKGVRKTIFTVDHLAPFYKEITTDTSWLGGTNSGRSLKADIRKYMDEAKWSSLIKALGV